MKDCARTLHTSLSLALLGAQTYIAATSTFQSWLPVLITYGIGIFGTLLLNYWQSRAFICTATASACVNILVELEDRMESENMPLDDESTAMVGNSLRNVSSKNPYKRKVNPSGTHLFRASFALVPLLLTLVTVLATVPAIHAFVQPLLPTR